VVVSEGRSMQDTISNVEGPNSIGGNDGQERYACREQFRLFSATTRPGNRPCKNDHLESASEDQRVLLSRLQSWQQTSQLGHLSMLGAARRRLEPITSC
jgi:hypothetical protein